MSEARKRKVADVSFTELIHLTTIWARLPLVLLWICGKNLVSHRDTFRRSTANAMIRWFNSIQSVAQVQYVTPSSVDTYKRWAKSTGLPITVEALVDDTFIMWIGKKRTDRVVLYFHGGAYFAPLLDFPLAFWHYVQQQLLNKDCDVGFAVLGYSLVPSAAFPTQLRQATVAVEHLIHTGVHPSNLHLAGDSAGGNLILSLLSHIIHPLPSIPKISLPFDLTRTPIRSVYLMSPWVSLDSNSASFNSNAPEEMFSTANARAYGHLFLDLGEIGDEERPYVEPVKAPAEWFAGLGAIADRILITVGDKELFLDDIVQFNKTLKIDLGKAASKVTFVVQEGGVHDDPFMDFFVKLPIDRLGTLTPLIVQWLADGIKPPDVGMASS